MQPPVLSLPFSGLISFLNLPFMVADLPFLLPGGPVMSLLMLQGAAVLGLESAFLAGEAQKVVLSGMGVDIAARRGVAAPVAAVP